MKHRFQLAFVSLASCLMHGGVTPHSETPVYHHNITFGVFSFCGDHCRQKFLSTPASANRRL